ncbi:MAG: hypothetical protein R3C03_16390 [Pirellulaceae bacterium]
MKRLGLWILGGFAATTLTGCALCCSPYLDDYPTYGGRVQRIDQEYGRVGSVFSDPNMAGGGPSADSNLENYVRDPQRNTPELLDSPSGNNESEELPRPILGGDDSELPPPEEDSTTRNMHRGNIMRGPNAIIGSQQRRSLSQENFR